VDLVSKRILFQGSMISAGELAADVEVLFFSSLVLE
jgi:hypothetical protein